MVGAALTTRPTPHRFRVRGNDLYAWCALDAIFLPGLIDATAEVRSTCPETGQKIHLDVAPDRVESWLRGTGVLSVVIPLTSDAQLFVNLPRFVSHRVTRGRDRGDGMRP